MRIFILTLLLMSSTTFAQSNVSFCHAFLTEHANLSLTEIFFVYLQELNNGHVVSMDSLKILKTELEKKNSLTNPVNNKNSSDAEVHASMVQQYLDNSELDQNVLLTLLTQFLNKQEQTQASKNKSHEETAKPYKTIKFNTVEKGSFTHVTHIANGSIVDEQLAQVDHSFMMMDSLVTVQMWTDIFTEDGKIKYPDYDENVLSFLAVEQLRAESHPDLPISQVSRIQAMLFANKLSEKQGLKPAYIIQTITKGMVTSVVAEINDPSGGGDPYKTEGYRLPNWQELGLVRTNHGQIRSDQPHPDVNMQNRGQYVEWDILPVGDLRPLNNNGQFFYDLYNGHEWSYNSFPYINKELAQPQYAFFGAPDSRNLTSTNLNHPTRSGGNLGFRLVRTIHPWKKP